MVIEHGHDSDLFSWYLAQWQIYLGLAPLCRIFADFHEKIIFTYEEVDQDLLCWHLELNCSPMPEAEDKTQQTDK